MGADHSKSAIVKAIIGNAVVTVAKFIAYVFSGSGSMLSEAIHSLVDTLNQGLLFIGEHRSVLRANFRHPFGYGIEANFWGLLAAIGIMVFGGGISIQHGIHALSHPVVPTGIPLVMGILLFAFIVEAWVLWSVLKDVAKTRGDMGWIKHIGRQRAGTITVILEDAAAVLGVTIAAVAIGLSVATQNGVYDAIGQIIIGGLLFVVGLYLIIRNRGMIVGQSIGAAKESQLRIMMEDLSGIDRVTSLRTRQLGRGLFRVQAEVVFSGGYLAGKVLGDFTYALTDKHTPEEVNATLGRFADAVLVEQARHVDKIEEYIQQDFPGAIYIDLEPHLRDQQG